ncbi:basic secretory protein-like protein [Pseudoalteromonas ardens]|uniref:F5/8 type C domain-containing protein n=1 Tax=Pseudoalteromonas rubra TaxID=43658 RepID=A0A0L0EU12_9GAMM|nr:basic secretory protein-like protein [Pseudoalteromonas sp. R96]KNC67899.1 hypothetical protein AC626_07955 [Pseudoalteromonas rubra]MDK1310369.1 basic secretory protein-like protein [Pseudoalteromonas sp. R96]
MKKQHNYRKSTLALCLSSALLAPTSFASSDLTQPDRGVITASGENGTAEGRTKAFDDSQYSKWLTFAPTGWIAYQFSTPQVVSGYTLTSANDAASRDPQDWQLLGSNDGNTWYELDTQANQTFSARYQTRQYNVTNSQAYRHYKLNVTANQGAGILQLAEIELLGGATPPPNDALPLTDSKSLSKGSWQHYGPFNVAGKVSATTSGSGDADLYIGLGSQPTTSNYQCASTSPTATESCQAQGSNLYVSVYGWSATSYTINIKEESDNGSGNWDKPVVDFVDMNPETAGSQLVKRIISDPAAHMANRCVDVAQVLYTDPKESQRFRHLRFELREKDAWGNDFVAYKLGQDGSGEMTIAVSTKHLEKVYRDGNNDDNAIRDEIDGILFHEVTHGYNNSPITHDGYGDGGPYWAYTEGLADAVRIGAGFHKTRQPDITNPKKWLGGYTTTGFFLHYIKQEKDPLFIRKFNQSAVDYTNYTWSFDRVFTDILGIGVEQAWQDYVQFIQNGGQLQY